MVYSVHSAILNRGFLWEMYFPDERIPRFCDNHGAIEVASQVEHGGRAKHVEIKLKYTQEYMEI